MPNIQKSDNLLTAESLAHDIMASFKSLLLGNNPKQKIVFFTSLSSEYKCWEKIYDEILSLIVFSLAMLKVEFHSEEHRNSFVNQYAIRLHNSIQANSIKRMTGFVFKSEVDAYNLLELTKQISFYNLTQELLTINISVAKKQEATRLYSTVKAPSLRLVHLAQEPHTGEQSFELKSSSSSNLFYN